MSWYLRSMADRDTHRGAMTGGMVVARCGIRFEPRTIALGAKALPGKPPDPDQICPDCLHKVDGQVAPTMPSPRRDE